MSAVFPGLYHCGGAEGGDLHGSHHRPGGLGGLCTRCRTAQATCSPDGGAGAQTVVLGPHRTSCCRGRARDAQTTAAPATHLSLKPGISGPAAALAITTAVRPRRPAALLPPDLRSCSRCAADPAAEVTHIAPACTQTGRQRRVVRRPARTTHQAIRVLQCIHPHAYIPPIHTRPSPAGPCSRPTRDEAGRCILHLVGCDSTWCAGGWSPSAGQEG